MAAATINGSNVGATTARNRAKAVQNKRAGAPFALNGEYWFDRTESFATTAIDDANDETFFFTAPDQSRITELYAVASDMDSGTNMVFDVIAENAAGTEIVLINDTTIGQAGGTAALDTAKAFTDVSNMKIGVKIGVAGTTAGTIRLIVKLLIGNQNEAFIAFS